MASWTARFREVGRLEPSALSPTLALPSAVGYAIPLLVGWASHHLADGVAASAGALIVGFANFGGSYRARSGVLLVTTLTAGIAALVGGAVGSSGVATVVIISLWGFGSGFLVAYGPRPAFVGLLSTWALLLASDLHLHGEAVLHETRLVLAGGAVQLLVEMSVWPLRRDAPERRSVANAYASLARCARTPGFETLQASAQALQAAVETVGQSGSSERKRTALRSAIEQGEWIRLELAALAGLDRQEVLDAAAEVLEALATHGDPSSLLEVLDARVRDVPDPVASQRAQALSRWTTAAVTGSVIEVPVPSTRQRPIEVLRAEWHLDSSTLRHALRLGAALAVACAVYRGFSLGSGYWVPLTVLFVLKPDYGTTMSRAVGRAVGTGVGVTIAWVVVTPFSPSDGVIVALLAVLAFGAYAVFSANYALFSVLLAVLIALLVQFSGGSPVGALGYRLVDTAVGTAVALVAITVWPSREVVRTRQALATYVTLEGHWVDSALEACGDGDPGGARSARLATRAARSDAHEAVRRALADAPGRRLGERPLPRRPRRHGHGQRERLGHRRRRPRGHPAPGSRALGAAPRVGRAVRGRHRHPPRPADAGRAPPRGGG